MGDLIRIGDIKELAGGKDLKALTCKSCGGQVWVALYSEEEENLTLISVLACAGCMEDGSKCECVIDLDEVVWDE